MGIPHAHVETGQGSPRFHVHVEEGRGRGALTSLLVVPREPGALADALRDLHDPAGPADLDARLGRMAAAAPRGTGFVVALDDLAWVFPSEEVRCRHVHDETSEDLDVPQVVRLKPGDSLDVVSTDGAVFGRVRADGPAAGAAAIAPRDEPAGASEARPRRVSWRRVASTTFAFGGAALLVAGFLALSPSRQSKEGAPRQDAAVAPSLEDRIVGLLTRSTSHPAVPSEDGTPEASATAPAAPEEKTPANDPATQVSDVAAAESTDEALEQSPPDDTERAHTTARPHAWEFRAGGAITSSPFLAEGRILFGSRDGKLYCLDAASGDVEWTFRAGSGIGSSPCVSGDLCFVGTYAGEVLAVHVESGERVWRAKTKGRVVASPCVVDGTVVIGSYDGSVWAFDAESGEKRWAAATGAAVRASPEPIGEDAVAVGSTEGTVYCLTAENGKSRWRRAVGSAVNAAAAYDAEENRLFVGARNGTFLCLNAETGDVVWSAALGAAVNARPRIAGEMVLVGTGRGRLVALDRANGHKRWDTQAERGFDATPLVLGTRVLAPSSDGTLHILDAGSGEVQDRRRLPAEVFTSPASADGLLYLGTLRGTFHALTLP